MEEKFLSSPRNIMVLLCAGSYGMLVIGTSRLSSQLFLALMDQFHIGRKEASVPFTLVFQIRSLAGPLVDYLGRKYGARLVADIGFLLCVIGVGGCFFATDITTVSILWGVVFGLGSGFGVLLVPNILRDFFEKHYDKSHGCFKASSGLGGILLPILAETVLFQYGVTGTYLIFSAIMANCFVASLVLRTQKIGPITTKKPKRNVFAIDIGNTKDSPDAKTQQEDEIPVSNLQNDSQLHNLETKSVEQRIDILQWRKGEEINNVPVDLISYKAKPFQSEEMNHGTDVLACELINVNKLSKENSEQNPYHPKDPVTNGTNVNSTKIMLEILQVFADPPFIIILITEGLYTLVFQTFITIIIDFARDIGVSPELEIYFLIIFSFSDLLGRLFLGYVTDGGYLSHVNFYVITFFIAGAMLSVLTVVKNFVLIMIVFVFIGLPLGGTTMMSIGLMFCFIEKERMIIAVPCRNFLYPFLGLTKPFLIEYFREGQGSYNGLLFSLAGMCIFNSIIALFLPASKRLAEKWKAK